jgi:hypothetical protein
MVKEGEKACVKRQCWRDGDGDKWVTQCVHWKDYGSNNMVVWEICNDLRSNFKLINKMLCIDFLRTSCMMSPYEKPWW